MDSYFTDDQTLTLLKLVHTKDMQDKFNSNKKKHRKVWEEISQILESQGIKKSAAKCQNRYENTKRSYNTIKRNHIGSEKPNYAYWDFWENDNFKCVHGTAMFTDRETDELLLIMGEPATWQIFIKHRKNHRIAWNYILKRLTYKGIHKTADKIKNRFENLKRKYMHYKKNIKNTSEPPDWRYWNVFEEYMASRTNPTESDFMTDEPQAEIDDDWEELEADVNETDFEDTGNKSEKSSTNEDILHSKVDNNSQISYNPIDDNIRLNENVCRICLQSEPRKTSESMVNLFSPLNENIRINEALAICVGLEIFHDPPITNQICMDCINQLRATYNFRKLCWASEYELKSNGLNFQFVGRNCDNDDIPTDNQRVLRQRPIRKSIKQELLGGANKYLLESDAQDEVATIPQFETIYEFVDTNPKEHVNASHESDKAELMSTEENNADESTIYPQDNEQEERTKRSSERIKLKLIKDSNN